MKTKFFFIGMLVMLLAGGVQAQKVYKTTECIKCHQKKLQVYQKAAHQHDPYANGECDTCHAEQHKKFTSQGAALCADCHDDSYDSAKCVHAPVKQGRCTACHDPHASNHEKFLVQEEDALCKKCHHLAKPKVVHDAIESGSCSDCHKAHAAEHKALLKQKTAKLCEECHEIELQNFSHGPYAVGSCTACHNAHGSDFTKILRRPEKDLCLSCHKKFAQNWRLPHKHKIINEKGCHPCHSAHSSAYRYQLKKAPQALCMSCHNKIASLVKQARCAHGPVVKNCLSCHVPHSSKPAALLTQEQPGLCLSCHGQVKSQGVALIDIKTLLQKSKYVHDPVQEGCTDCHGVHGTKFNRLLSQAYPAAFYSSFTEEKYALCFNCHDSSAFLTAKTKDATEFRNGDVNLHFLHVNMSKGRSCRACHDVHACNGPKQIRAQVPFGVWQLPLNFQKTANGGSCLPGCHRKYSYDRNKKITNRWKK